MVENNEQFNSGQWSERVRINQCMDEEISTSTDSIKLIAEVLEQGTGQRVKSYVQIENNLAGFELIPVRPGLYRGLSSIPILIKVIDRRLTKVQDVIVDVRCVSTDKTQSITLNSYEGKTESFLIIPFTPNLYEHNCRVLLLQARRKIGRRLSRAITLMLPSLDHSQILQDWVKWSPSSLANSVTYRVGEKFRASVPVHLATKLNYLVVCQGETIAEAGHARDDGEITFETTAAMVPYCVLYVFSVNEAVQIDMILFLVEPSCQNLLSVSKELLTTNHNVTIAVTAPSNSLALLSAVDIRILELMQKYASHSTSKYWDWSVSKREVSAQAFFLGLIDTRLLNNEIKETCEEAGVLMLQHLKTCPNFMESTSALSDLCLQSFILSCERLSSPTSTSKVCDRKTGRGCSVDNTGEIKLSAAHMHWLMAGSSKRIQTRLDDSVFEVIRRQTDLSSVIRQYFPEVWLFSDFHLGSSGKLNKTFQVPDTVTQWFVQSSIWTPGNLAICYSAPSTVTVEKKFFMDINLPKHVYVNESVTAHVSVFADKLENEMTFSVCMAGLDRHVCGDVGAYGERGQPAYNRIYLTPIMNTSAKEFALRFLRVGKTEVVFTLKEEISYPGRYHCNIGKTYDAVKLIVTVDKRADIEEHFKRLILNPLKPLNRLTRPLQKSSHMLLSSEDEIEDAKKNIIDYSEYRSEHEPQKLYTNISINLPDTESVHSITIELSQFLSDALITDSIMQNEISSRLDSRWKRSTVSGHESFLTDIISSLASNLYHFKSLHFLDEYAYQKSESFDDTIGSLMSAMLTFSSCRGSNSRLCAFSNYRNRNHSHQESFFLTALSTSLLCEASVDERIICPLLTYLLNKITANVENLQDSTDNFLNPMDFMTVKDKYWLVLAMINQISFDCATYQCVRNDRAWISIRRSFFNLSDSATLDVRTMAALAYMAPRSVSSIMRIKMYSIVKDGMLPYWVAGRMLSDGSILTKLRSRFSNLLGRRISKSGDLLANSLGLLAFVSRGVEPIFPTIELDLLADWIYEQLSDNIQLPSAVDAYFANRAIYEYRVHKTKRTNGTKQDKVTIICKNCKQMIHNVTARSSLFNLPVTVRNITLITEGVTKVRTGIRIWAAKRMRMRRGLEQNDFYPCIISVAQYLRNPGIIQQIVCLKISTPVIESLEVTHGLFTGFTSSNKQFRLLENSTIYGVRIGDQITVSSYAVHFVLVNLKPNVPICYELGLTEPKNIYEPDQLAPVAITLRHPFFGIAGQELLVYTERYKRSTLEEAIDMVCWDRTCSCAEASCAVRCSQCHSINRTHLQNELCSENTFGSTVEVENYSTQKLHSSEYFVIDVSLKHWKQKDMKSSIRKPDRIEVWLRTCNIRCPEPKVGDTYYFSGNINGMVMDYETSIHYVLRDEDRWELASEECGHLFSYLITSRPC
ncbi:unnamed protein product [Thelazia callipaeda]|uniref:A2M domain-containing protein n=1 Tax=Thelazia callipaeda TaxID=103827 RepID=A0A158RCS8_THECL|nr:unnamed protein product [Thelazia callipaeda]